MTVILARLKQAATWLWTGLVLVGAVLVWTWFRRRPPPKLGQADPVDLAMWTARRRREVASAEAAVKIAAARATHAAEQAGLQDILADPDEDRRNQRLIEVAKHWRKP